MRSETNRDSDDLTTLILRGEEVFGKTKDAYRNLVTLLENESVYHYGFQNTTDETVYLAMRTLDINDSLTTRHRFRLELESKRPQPLFRPSS